MAIVVESTTISSGFDPDDGSTGTQWYWDITKPTGLAVGDLMMLFNQVEDGSALSASGWTALSGVSKGGILYKYADSSDVAASDFRFFAGNDVSTRDTAWYRLHRITGASSVAPIQAEYNSAGSSASSPLNFDPDINPPLGTLMYYFVNGDETGVASPNTFSLSVTGPTGTVTELSDNLASTGAYNALYEQITTSKADITDIEVSFTPDAAGDDTINIKVIALYPQQDASDTLSLTINTNSTFATAGSAGANTTPTFVSNTNTAFSPQSRATSPTSWTNESQVSTSWTDEDKL